ncbi:MAG: DUF3575 domain-containing protein [Bacteroidota bacterium]
MSLAKKFLNIGIAALLAVPLQSQPIKDSTYLNALKLNSAALMFKNASLLYERGLNDHWSLLIGGGLKWGGKIPKAIGLGDFVITSNNRGLRGFSVTPEARYYFNFCECGGTRTGFYTGLYSRMTKFYGDLRFNYWNGSEYIDVGGSARMREMGIGLQLGYQFIFKERFVVDLMFAGPRTSRQQMRFKLDSDYAAELIPAIEEEINKRLEWWGMDPISIPVSADAEVNFGFNNFRYAIAIGYLF